jgi:hypothetical protein
MDSPICAQSMILVSLPEARLAGHLDGTSTTIDLGGGGVYTHLFAKYNGPNYGSVVWYVGNLTGRVCHSRLTWRVWSVRIDAF